MDETDALSRAERAAMAAAIIHGYSNTATDNSRLYLTFEPHQKKKKEKEKTQIV
jgi:hypothetical protein